MSEKKKLEFRLLPVSGVTSGKGYRAEFVHDTSDIVGFDGVIAEAQQAEVFGSFSPRLLRTNLEAFFETMVANTLKDGRTRRLDGLFEVSLRIHGGFENETDDFDPEQHKMELVLKPLRNFTQKPKNIKPLNVNRIKAFRLTSITAADGLHPNKVVVFGQDVVIHGTSLPKKEEASVIFNLSQLDGKGFGAEAEIVSITDTKAVCRWTKHFTPPPSGTRLTAIVTWYEDGKGESSVSREIKAGIVSE